MEKLLHLLYNKLPCLLLLKLTHMLYGVRTVQLSRHRKKESFMDGSRVTQCLDSLWFYNNILTCRNEPVASLTYQFSPLIHAKEPPKGDLQQPNIPLVLLSQQVENFTPRCHKVGEISSAFEEEVRVMPELVKSEKRERRKWKKLGLTGMEVILGGLDLGFDVLEVSGFLKFKEESCNKYQMLTTQQQAKMPAFEDDVAMKQHLKSWAYAVACTVK